MKHTFFSNLNRLFLLTFIVASSLFTTACQKDAPELKDYSGIDNDIITKYLADNNITTAQKQPSGLYFIPITTNPTGVKIAAGSIVSVLYTGRLLDAAGTVFDATSSRNNTPLTFVVGGGQLIPGFEAGVALMHIGDKAELLIPSALAYGPSSKGAVPANAVLRFEVEVVDFTVVDEALIAKYLADNNITNAVRQPSGLYYAPLTTNPSGILATAGKTASVLYTGKLLNGTVFDATSQRNNTPFNFVLGSGQVIRGWDEGIALMRTGEKGILLIPSALGYGPRGAGNGAIPSNAVLRFDVELVDVK
ncbi:FKBP-type peptidyl-prolyl cis-trans isomerase [Hymenobacter sp. B1770]|uniref:FKBP-type peptidyl-prolyl cis-trans isomerase n=1 Tax=Hymenobacter sp. B1770 TaxID=1718788 RepID=UPI003CF7871E